MRIETMDYIYHFSINNDGFMLFMVDFHQHRKTRPKSEGGGIVTWPFFPRWRHNMTALNRQ
jgi:hypothetical protein